MSQLNNLIENLRQLGVCVPQMVGAKLGPQITFEDHLRTKVCHRTYQVWAAYAFTELDEQVIQWSQSSSLVGSPVGMITCWIREHGDHWWVEVDFVCCTPVQLELWLRDVVTQMMGTKFGSKPLRHTQIGSLHQSYLPSTIVDWLNANATPQASAKSAPWAWWWDYLTKAERQAVLDAEQAVRDAFATKRSTEKVEVRDKI